MSIFEDINHLLKYKNLTNEGYNVIENVPYEVLDDSTFDISVPSDLNNTKESNENT